MSHKQYFKKIDPAIFCPINAYVDTNNPTLLGNACTIGGYIPDPTIPIPDPGLDAIITTPSILIPANSYKYVLYIFDRSLSPAGVMFTCTATGCSENVVLDMAGNVLVTNANTLATFNIGNYSQSKFAIRLRFAAATNITINPAQTAGFLCTGLIGIISSVQSTNVTCLNQSYLKRIKFLEPLVNIATLRFEGCVKLYDIIWADTSFAFLTTSQYMFSRTGFVTLNNLPAMPALAGIDYFLYNQPNITEFTMPFSLSVVNDMTSAFYLTPKLKVINGVGAGGILTLNFTAMTNGGNHYSVFGYCGFAGKMKIGFPNITSSMQKVFEFMPNCTDIEFTALPNGATAINAALIENCPALKTVIFPDSYRGSSYMLNGLLTGTFEELETIQFPMDNSGSYMNSNQATFLTGIASAPKLKTVRGRLIYPYTIPNVVNLSAVNAITLTDSDGKFPKLEEIDYPLLPFTNFNLQYTGAFKKLTAKIVTTLTIYVKNANLDVVGLNSIIESTVPWQIPTNNSKQIELTGNKQSLPIFYIQVYSASTTTIYQDTIKCYKSSSAGTPVVGWKLAQSIFVSVSAGAIGSNLTFSHGVTLAYALPIGTCIVQVGSYSGYAANVPQAEAAGFTNSTKFYIISATYSAPNVFYTVSLTPGGAPVTLTAVIASALSIAIRHINTIIGVTSDASYWYLVLSLSSFNFSSSYMNNQTDVFDPAQIDSDKCLFLNRGLLY